MAKGIRRVTGVTGATAVAALTLGDKLVAELASMRPEKDVVVEFKVCLYRYRCIDVYY